MSVQAQTCPVCTRPAELSATESRRTTVKCHYCGQFEITFSAVETAKVLDDTQRFALGTTIRTRTEQLRPGSSPIHVDTYMVDEIIQGDAIDRIKSITVPEKLDLALDWLASNSKHPGHNVQFRTEFAAYAFYAWNRDECIYLLNALAEMNLIERRWAGGDNPQGDAVITIKPAGWERIASRVVGGPASNIAFVAMWFDPRMNPVLEAISKGVRACGYNPKRVDSEPHTLRIDQKIIADIRASKFIVADVTGQRQGVYYEAGFANGINRPVIWTCRDDDKANIHFDTRQFPHLFWRAPEDLALQVENMVMGLLGPGKLKLALQH